METQLKMRKIQIAQEDRTRNCYDNGKFTKKKSTRNKLQVTVLKSEKKKSFFFSFSFNRVHSFTLVGKHQMRLVLSYCLKSSACTESTANAKCKNTLLALLHTTNS